jgi:stage II sporulation protein AA (anti-sigma F factor antagonist)
MTLSFQDHDQLTVMTVQGNLVADQMRKAVTGKLEAHTRDFVLDLTDMPFVDSQGLETLLWMQDQCADQLGQVQLAACQDTVQQILTITRLASRFDCHDDVEAAIKSLR